MLRALICISLIILIEESFAQKTPQFVFESDQISIMNADRRISVKVYMNHLDFPTTQNSNSIIGTVSYNRKTTLFIPFVPLGRDQEYTLRYGEHIQHFYLPIAEDYTRVVIKEVYPKGGLLPSNLLKWYIRFSAPVSLVNLYDHIHIKDENGKIVERAILPLDNVLVSEDGTMITLWMEPGRQKRGLGPSDELGPIFQEGKKYTFCINKSLRDTNGITIDEGYSRSFLVTEPDRSKPTIEEAVIDVPEYSSLSPLIVKFKTSFDYGSSLDRIKLLKDNKEMRGQWISDETSGLFYYYPDLLWQKGIFEIEFDPTIEDLAGNSFIRLFDQPLDLSATDLKLNNQLKFTIQ